MKQKEEEMSRDKTRDREFLVENAPVAAESEMTLSHSRSRVFRIIGFAIMVSSCTIAVHLVSNYNYNYHPTTPRTLLANDELVSPGGQDDRDLLFPKDFPGLEFDSDQVQNVLEIGGQDPDRDAGLPSVINGLWFVGRDPDITPFVPTVISSFAGASWNAKKRTATLIATRPRVWAWRGDDVGLEAAMDTYMFVRFSPAYVLVFSEDFKFVQVQPQFTILFKPIRVPVFLIDFHMTLQDDDTWFFERKFFWVSIDPYFYRRIVDANGNRIQPAYDNFLADSTPTLWTIDYT